MISSSPLHLSSRQPNELEGCRPTPVSSDGFSHGSHRGSSVDATVEGW